MWDILYAEIGIRLRDLQCRGKGEECEALNGCDNDDSMARNRDIWNGKLALVLKRIRFEEFP